MLTTTNQIPFCFLQELDCIWWLHYWCRSDKWLDDLIQKKCFKNAEASKMRCASFFSFQLLHQRFSIPVLAYPRSAHFVCFSYRFRRLFYSTVSALRSGHHRIFRHDSSSNWTYIFHSKGIEVCETWIEIIFIYRGISYHTSRFASKFRLCVKMLCSANPWMTVPKLSKLQRISPAQGVGSNGHCVGTMA